MWRAARSWTRRIKKKKTHFAACGNAGWEQRWTFETILRHQMCLENCSILGPRTSTGIAAANPDAETAQRPQYGRAANIGMPVIPGQECGWLDGRMAGWLDGRVGKISMRLVHWCCAQVGDFLPVIPSRSPCLATIPGAAASLARRLEGYQAIRHTPREACTSTSAPTQATRERCAMNPHRPHDLLVIRSRRTSSPVFASVGPGPRPGTNGAPGGLPYLALTPTSTQSEAAAHGHPDQEFRLPGERKL